MKLPLVNIDTFSVISKSLINDQNHKILSLLYQPIIGGVAINLYITLLRYLDNSFSVSGILHSDLVNVTQIKLSDILEAREKLEAIGLLKTYVIKGNVNKYVYELYNPISEKQFIENPVLHSALYNNVTKTEYKRIINNLTVPKVNLSNYENISCKFTDIFSFLATDKQILPNIKNISHNDLAFEPNITLNEVLSLIPDGLLEYKKLTPKSINLLHQYSIIYNLNNKAMSEVILNSILDKKINVNLLKENCKTYYSLTTEGQIPKIVYQNQPLNLRQAEITNTKKSKLINQFETTSPHEFLSMKQGATKPTKKDLELLEYLLIELELHPAVVNVLIDYVLRINNNKLVKAYVQQIAVQWKRNKIINVEDAMDLAKKEQPTKNKKTTQKTKQEQIPDWFDKKITSNEATEEEIKELERKLQG